MRNKHARTAEIRNGFASWAMDFFYHINAKLMRRMKSYTKVMPEALNAPPSDLQYSTIAPSNIDGDSSLLAMMARTTEDTVQYGVFQTVASA
jgi:hypothetical protein